MEGRRDLRKFISESRVAQRRGMLSSGRTATLDGTGALGWTPAGTGADGEIDAARRLTPSAGIESSPAMGSDLWAAEALQRQGAKSVPVTIDRDADAAVRVAGGRTDRLTRRPISALRPESQPVRSCGHAGESMQLVEGWRSWELRWRK
jgi:hypothetical protein